MAARGRKREKEKERGRAQRKRCKAIDGGKLHAERNYAGQTFTRAAKRWSQSPMLPCSLSFSLSRSLSLRNMALSMHLGTRINTHTHIHTHTWGPLLLVYSSACLPNTDFSSASASSRCQSPSPSPPMPSCVANTLADAGRVVERVITIGCHGGYGSQAASSPYLTSPLSASTSLRLTLTSSKTSLRFAGTQIKTQPEPSPEPLLQQLPSLSASLPLFLLLCLPSATPCFAFFLADAERKSGSACNNITKARSTNTVHYIV